jgi:hypothetical protein
MIILAIALKIALMIVSLEAKRFDFVHGFTEYFKKLYLMAFINIFDLIRIFIILVDKVILILLLVVIMLDSFRSINLFIDYNMVDYSYQFYLKFNLLKLNYDLTF